MQNGLLREREHEDALSIVKLLERRMVEPLPQPQAPVQPVPLEEKVPASTATVSLPADCRILQSLQLERPEVGSMTPPPKRGLCTDSTTPKSSKKPRVAVTSPGNTILNYLHTLPPSAVAATGSPQTRRSSRKELLAASAEIERMRSEIAETEVLFAFGMPRLQMRQSVLMTNVRTFLASYCSEYRRYRHIRLQSLIARFGRPTLKVSRGRCEERWLRGFEEVRLLIHASVASNPANSAPGAPSAPVGLPVASEESQNSSEAILKEFLQKDVQREEMRRSRATDERRLAIQRQIRLYQMEQQSVFPSPPWILNDQYGLLRLLGRGGFSMVWLALDARSLTKVVCKIHQLNWPAPQRENYIRHVMREVTINKNLNHPNIASYHDAFEIDQNTIATVLEYCKGVDLEEYLRHVHRLKESDAKSLLFQMLKALYYMNTLPPGAGKEKPTKIIHYDLKPANILLTRNGVLKLVDFGLSKLFNYEGASDQTSMELTSPGSGTYWYLPPECFRFLSGTEATRISSNVDVWSVGVIYYQMIYGRRPFGHEQSQSEILRQGTIINAKNVEFPMTPPLSEEGKSFIRECLTYDCQQRPDVIGICHHRYIAVEG